MDEEKIYKISVAYDGQAFSGFQSQALKDIVTIQDVLEEKLELIFAEPISIRVAGRTDAGVHALEQVISFKSKVERKDEVLLYALNSLLPDTIRVLQVRHMDKNFHARFSAKSRQYEYLIKDDSKVDPFFRDRILFVKPKLNLELMAKGAGYLIGSHDFASFGSQVPKGDPTIRRMEKIEIFRQSCSGPGPFANLGDLIVLQIKANAFLRRMVRMICATLIKVGSGELKPIDVKSILEKADPCFCPPPASPGGLYLKYIEYAQD